MPFQIDGRGDMNAFVLTSRLAGIILLTRRQSVLPSAAHDKFRSICTIYDLYTEFGIVGGGVHATELFKLFLTKSLILLSLNQFTDESNP